MVNKKGQVWVETVTYTLIAFVMIGLVLSFAKPKIEELQDKTIIDQSIKILKEIDSAVLEVNEEGVGNKRKIEMGIKKGTFYINSSQDKIIFELTGGYMYSQPGQSFEQGSLNITTLEYGSKYKVTIERNYAGIYNLTYGEQEKSRTLVRAPTDYELYISNKGGSPTNIDLLVA